MTRTRYWLLSLFFLWPLLAGADDLALRPDHPDEYVVVRGDTLWDISGRFLEKPWYWPKLWGVNPQISNPHLIYPGDRLRLVMTADGPRLIRDGGGGPDRLSPQVRSSAIDTAIPPIPFKHVQAFLEEAVVLRSNQPSDFAYVAAAADEHLTVGAGGRVYARQTSAETGQMLDIYRIGDPYFDPETGEALGYAALFIGQGKVQRSGDPATLAVIKARREVLAGDVLIPTDDRPMQASYLPHAPSSEVRGHIISVVDGVSQIGQYSVVALSRGRRDGLELGHVLQVRQIQQPIDDPVARQRVQPPSEPAGAVIVFRLFERVSYALVMRASRPMHVLDEVTPP
ncbi:MAG: LysM peptidoglycan-binding domain-containing protein [Immundisolibacter sp.]|uniref:LysM peptidoglycan-binding domain-containing protein n=1 Tax=Immundisolibacter sp. TaxID=1934948 RepID=UPI003EE207FC